MIKLRRRRPLRETVLGNVTSSKCPERTYGQMNQQSWFWCWTRPPEHTTLLFPNFRDVLSGLLMSSSSKMLICCIVARHVVLLPTISSHDLPPEVECCSVKSQSQPACSASQSPAGVGWGKEPSPRPCRGGEERHMVKKTDDWTISSIRRIICKHGRFVFIYA